MEREREREIKKEKRKKSPAPGGIWTHNLSVMRRVLDRRATTTAQDYWKMTFSNSPAAFPCFTTPFKSFFLFRPLKNLCEPGLEPRSSGMERESCSTRALENQFFIFSFLPDFFKSVFKPLMSMQTSFLNGTWQLSGLDFWSLTTPAKF